MPDLNIPGHYVRGEERHRQHNSIIEGIIHLTHRIGLLPMANERSLTNLATNINSIYCLHIPVLQILKLSCEYFQ
jgi:hypothetical protein